ncbi:MAG: SDR family NAD(P)-dependent oxidoreductase, partial [Spirochaetes bacterium]|nr:SDR family NAD(P)-dependent oxidoreductase [Spirochaetota bacterium]
MKLTYSGKYALLTGGTSTLAITLSEIMIRSGLHPVLTYRNDKGLAKINHALKSHTGLYSTAPLDINDRLSLGALFTGMVKIDYLIDLAHGDLEKLISSASSEDVEKYFSGNISFRAELIKYASRIMLKQKRGRFIFISSTSAERSNPGQGFYAAAKLASEALYRNIGIELAGRGITALTLRTAYIDA